MSKHQLIESIREHNPTADSDFLVAFDEEALHRYLHHLRYMRRPRGAASFWIRTGDSSAVVTRDRS